MDRKLIVNADDFGRSPGVSKGIRQAHLKGIVTSTTVLINLPEIETLLAKVLSCHELGIGLHLVFTAGRPVLPPDAVPGLVDTHGRFLEQHTLWARAETVPADQLHAELSTQIARFVTITGRLPDHLDCHHFVHLHPAFFEIYAGLAEQFRLPIRAPFPIETDFRQAVSALPFLEGFPPDLVRGMIVTNSALLRARGLAHPDHFVSTFFGKEALTLDYLLHLLTNLPTGITELMCHPGYCDLGLSNSSYRHEREIELNLLTNPIVRERLDQLDIKLVTFAAVR
jgi:predicted glycoside hydrolase/deacetylase ChbG (UPF0249 family)